MSISVTTACPASRMVPSFAQWHLENFYPEVVYGQQPTQNGSRAAAPFSNKPCIVCFRDHKYTWHGFGRETVRGSGKVTRDTSLLAAPL